MKFDLTIFFILLVTLCACKQTTDPFEAYQNGDYETAIDGLLSLSAKGNLSAMTHLGVMYQVGLGVEKDLVKAVNYYQQAASLGFSAAQYNLGLLYQSGLGVKQDYTIAYELFTRAADQGHRKAKAAADVLLTELKVTFP